MSTAANCFGVPQAPTWRWRVWLAAVTCCGLSLGRSAGATPPDVSLTSVLGQPGAVVPIELVLSTNGSTVGAAAVDIQFDMRTLSVGPAACQAGPAASAAGKQLVGPTRFCGDHTTACTDDSECGSKRCDTLRIGVFGLNRGQILDGTIATCQVTIDSGATPGLYRLTNGAACPQGNCARAVDPDGRDIAGTTGRDGFVDVLGNMPTGGRRTTTPTASKTPRPNATATRTGSPSSPAPTPAPRCGGDCNGDGEVTADEMLLAGEIVFGDQPVTVCPNGDIDGNRLITAYELLAGVRNATQGCP